MCTFVIIGDIPANIQQTKWQSLFPFEWVEKQSHKLMGAALGS